MHSPAAWPALCQQLSELAASAPHWLTDGTRAPVDAIHDLRVGCKRLRAGWQLLSPWQDPLLCRQRRQAIAALARSLAGNRDQDVLLETLQRLHAVASPREQQALQRLQQRLCQAPDSQAAVAVPLHVLRTEQVLWRAFAGVTPPADWWPAGLARLQQQARTCATRAADGQQDEDFHAWRKWVKYELYAGELAGGVDASRQAALKQLGSLLGKLHDLTELQALLARQESSLRQPLQALLRQQVAERKAQALASPALW